MPPPNTPEEGLAAATAATTTLALRPFVRAEAPSSAVVDLRTLEYEDPIDENLICPICRVALVSPVITNCDHVFCQKCLVKAHALNPVCPIDRLPLKLVSETRAAPKIVHNQLDSLQVRCPNSCRGCASVVARSLVENHVARYCDKTLVPCPHPSCDKPVARKDVGKGCLHYDVECEYCEKIKQKVDLEDHQDNECPNRKKHCELCDAEYLRHKQDEHTKECPESETPCEFATLGCKLTVRRKHLEGHTKECEYRVVGPVGAQLAELRAEIVALNEKDRLKDRRMKFLENKGFPLSSAGAAEPGSDMNLLASSANADSAPYESRDQYFLSLFETMESKVERLSSVLNEVEGRHSMLLFNETMQIKDQLTEIRSTLGVMGMHVRWLMNFRLQERGRAGTGPPPAIPTSFSINQGDPHNTGDPPIFSRRLSDTLRENPSRL
ncbi:hypothetical protein SLS62_001652 [Diatrype stigma]|uniref:Uncharacterized protein n=1 Tax=Diatrype stigma TaxID=117547 RepID=A0AAN9YTB2_9PEZI